VKFDGKVVKSGKKVENPSGIFLIKVEKWKYRWKCINEIIIVLDF
jgi:hypothetical protein